ncbi:MAG: mechanosensitive ion channel family protein [Cyclobacteriaceae bacterium]
MFAQFFEQIDVGITYIEGLSPYLRLLVVFMLSVLVGLLLRLILIRSLRQYNKVHLSTVGDSMIRNLSSRTWIFFPLLIFFITQPLLTFPSERTELIVFKLSQSMLILSFGWVLLKLVNVVEDVAYEHYSVQRKDTFKSRRIRTQLHFIRRFLKVTVVFLVVSAILLSFREVRNLGATLLTSAGVAGIIIGIAAQKTLANFIAGLQIAISQPIKIDDSVIVEGEWGWVEEITLTYVVVKVWDQRRVVLPIHYFIDKPFQNWTRTSSELLGPVMLYLDYSMPVDELRDELDRILQDEKLWDKKVKVVQVTDTTEKSMVVRVLVSAKDAPTAWDLRCLVREKLINFVRSQHPEALPKSRLSLMDSKPLKLSENGSNLQEKSR